MFLPADSTVPVGTTSNHLSYSTDLHRAAPIHSVVPVDVEGSRESQAGAAPSSCTNCVVGNLSVGFEAAAGVYDSSNGLVYVANSGSEIVTAFSSVTHAVVGSISVGASLGAMLYDSGNGYVYGADYSSNSVTVINGATNSVIGSIPVGRQPYSLAYDSENGYVYVANDGSDDVTVINGATDNVVGSIAVGVSPWGVAYDSANGRVYVANFDSSNITVINGTTDNVMGSVALGTNPWAVVCDTANGDIYVADGGTNNVTVIDGSTNTVVGLVHVGLRPAGVAYDTANGNIYVLNDWSNNVSVISSLSNSVIATIQGTYDVGFIAPLDIFYDNANGYIYALSSSMPTAMSVISPLESIPWISSFSSYPTPTRIGSTFLNVSATGGSPPYSYSFTGLPPGCTSSNTVSLQCTTFKPGNYTITVKVGDAFGNSTASLSLKVPMFGMTFGASLPTDHLNETTFLNVGISGGVPPYTFSYAGLPPGCASMNVSSLGCTPTRAGSYPVIVTATDSYGNTNSTRLTLVVLPGPTVSISPDRTSVDANETVTFHAVASGGMAPYTFNYSPSIVGARCVWSSGSDLSCTPEPAVQGNSFSVFIQVKDAFGTIATATSASVLVYPELSVTFMVSSSTLPLGQTVAFVANTTGGSPPYSYSYVGFPPGCVSLNRSSVGCLPTEADWYNVTVVVTDCNNGTTNVTVGLHVIFDFNIAAPSQVTLGTSLTISVNTNQSFSQGVFVAGPAGGFGVLTYNYSGLPPGCVSMDVAVLTCTPTSTGTYSVQINVHDQIGDHNTHTVVVQVVPGFLGLPGNDGYMVVGGVAAAVVIGIVVTVWMRKRRTHPEPVKDVEKAAPKSVEVEKPSTDEPQAK